VERFQDRRKCAFDGQDARREPHLTGLIGYYSFVSVTLNVFQVPVPPSAALLPE
jgi:hypothetical protein